MFANEPNIIGTCMQMCPISEVTLRNTEGLVHPLESDSTTSRKSKQTKTHQCPNGRTMVKEFVRSAAGQQTQDASILRPYEILLETVSYLLDDILSHEQFTWPLKYEFISNRLRAVRQDMIVQNLPKQQSILLLQPMVRFYAYSQYELQSNQTRQLNNSFVKLNSDELQECLKRVLVLYDECDVVSRWCAHNSSITVNYSSLFANNRGTIEAIYVLFNLSDSHALHRAISLPKTWKNTWELQQALSISLLYRQRNFARVCKLIQSLPFLLAAVAALHLPQLRQTCFNVMSTAYNSEVLSFPMQLLRKQLLYDTGRLIVSDLKYYKVQSSACADWTADESEIRIFFNRKKFDCSVPIAQMRHECFVNAKLCNSLPEIILYADY